MQGWTTKPASTRATWWAANVVRMRWNPRLIRVFCDICLDIGRAASHWVSLQSFINCSFTCRVDGKPYLQRANEQGTVIDSIFACLSYVFKHTSAGSSKKTTALIWTPSRRVQICRFPGHGLYCFGVGNKQRATVKWTWLIWQLHGEMDWHFVPLYIASDRIWCKT